LAKSRKQPTPALEVVASNASVAFAVHEYEHDPSHESFGLEAAGKTGIEAERIFKTLITSTGGRLVVGVVPVNRQLDLKALAKIVGEKSAQIAEVSVAERTTGYIVGAISQLGQKKRLTTVIDQSALQHETVYVSAGRRGLEIELSPADLIALTGATTALVAR
jgi:Cys-tRNA(Pro)/Cys-tRNA(Cys) deacylase